MTKYMERNKILVVDDEEDLCEILQFNLESEGFAVDIANSAEEALKLLTDEHELILLDVMMEGMSGFKMAEKVRKEMHMNTPIIFLTAKDTENDMLTGFSIGGDDYIAKPFSIKEVAARVKAVLKRAGNIALPEKKKTIEIGELTLDLNSKTVYLNEQQILLTKKRIRNTQYDGQSSQPGLFTGRYSGQSLARRRLCIGENGRRPHHPAQKKTRSFR